MGVGKLRNGQFTGELGARLRDEIESRTNGRLRVHFDHAAEGSERIVAHLGERSSRANSLSFVDVAVVETHDSGIVNRGDGVVRVLCEIEEEGARPKKIIGDLCNILFADGVQVSGHSYHLDQTYVVIGICCTERGKSEEKAKKLIARIRERVTTRSVSRIVGICRSTNEELMDAVKEDILSVVNCREHVRSLAKSVTDAPD